MNFSESFLLRDLGRSLTAICLSAAMGLAPLSAAAADGSPAARATMKGADGATLGVVTLVQTPGGVLLRGTLEGVPAGGHGFHIHETGKCDAADGFKSAGGHLAGDRSHGILVDGGPHPGDMPNLHAGADRILVVETVNARIDLSAGSALFDGDGSALMLHAGPDDYRSQPAGDAGDRIACGVIERD
ncbi:MAG: superoxide dismutase family protein [Rhodospirillaceae bacterium]